MKNLQCPHIGHLVDEYLGCPCSIYPIWIMCEIWQCKSLHCWSKMALNYWMMVERYPNLKEEVGGSFPGSEISSLLDRQLATWSIASCALVLACRPSIYIYIYNHSIDNVCTISQGLCQLAIQEREVTHGLGKRWAKLGHEHEYE